MPNEPLPLKLRRLHPAAVAPQSNHVGDAALDLCGVETVILEPMARAAIGIGWSIEFPSGYVGRILPRSGLALHHGLQVLGGVIDSNYRGEWKVILINLGSDPVELKAGDRIAQAVFYPVATIQLTEVEELTDSTRGGDGFGSTGR